uniref:Uncharacterized protein n=1 Tax=Chromera velia CCMP2878 TaxID=1169474 RepID=A0A0G4HNF0_9ALVE|eukprot:Cvel_29428.t1-p1 / transcript=Cvel_29428.t1 / gene=Cvel_29428 / organism=Chromera_velia_CCMP2878 / gene_product=hypothetical protein / transcript_product=hypothetical protein / location=Cvel_scaffold4020:1941-5820(+) / protein_length=260 / sequence_SO=supercontig / SO=protein_coding / is_pseudo=false
MSPLFPLPFVSVRPSLFPSDPLVSVRPPLFPPVYPTESPPYFYQTPYRISALFLSTSQMSSLIPSTSQMSPLFLSDLRWNSSPVAVHLPFFCQASNRIPKVRKPFDTVAFFSDKDPSPSHSNSSDVSGPSDASSRRSAAQRVGSACRKKRSLKQLKKVDLIACLKFVGKKEIVDFVSQWGEFSNVHLQRKHFQSTEEWRSNIIVALNKAGSDARAFRRDVRRWRRKRVNPEDIVEKMKQEYSLTLLAMQLAVQEHVQVFP